MAHIINRLFVYLHIMQNALQRYSKDSKIKRYSKQSLMSNLLVCCLPNVFYFHLCVKHLCFHAHWLSKLTGILLHLFLLCFVAWSFNPYLTVLFSV